MAKTSLTQLLNIKYPIIMAPMFLVTNTKMMIEALNCDIAACIPALNYRTDEELRNAIKEIREKITNMTHLNDSKWSLRNIYIFLYRKKKHFGRNVL